MPTSTIYDLPIIFSNGAQFDTTKAIDFSGDWTCLRIGIRQDVTIDQSAEAVLADAAGKVLVSAFQDDKIIMRVHMRLGAVIGRPITDKAPAGAKPWAYGSAEPRPDQLRPARRRSPRPAMRNGGTGVELDDELVGAAPSGKGSKGS